VDFRFRAYEPQEAGPDGYPPEWHSFLKAEVRRLAGHRCARCRHPYRNKEHGSGEWSPCDELCDHGGPLRFGEVVQARWRILTVHHLDGDKLNCRWWNLAALCQRCHLRVQMTVQMRQVYPWEHSEWFKPYAAGYYAWAYLGEEVSPEEAAARLTELLHLELAETRD
jgi:hypothetical protein